MRPDIRGRIAERANTQLGLIIRSDLRAVEARSDSFQRLVDAGEFERWCNHVFRHRAAPRTWRQDVMATLLDAGPGALTPGGTAARVWGVPGYDQRGYVHVLVKRGGSHRLCHGVLHETFWLPEHHRAERQGLPVVAVRRLPFELASIIRPSALRWVIDFCRNERGLTVDDLALTVAELCRSGRPGSAAMRLQVDELSPGYVPPNSVLAAKFRDLCIAHGLPVGVMEVHAGDDRWIGRVDVLYRDERVIAELDSRRWHNTRDGFESDRNRTNELVLAGWRVLRITWRMLHDHPDKVVTMIRRALCGR